MPNWNQVSQYLNIMDNIIFLLWIQQNEKNYWWLTHCWNSSEINNMHFFSTSFFKEQVLFKICTKLRNQMGQWVWKCSSGGSSCLCVCVFGLWSRRDCFNLSSIRRAAGIESSFKQPLPPPTVMRLSSIDPQRKLLPRQPLIPDPPHPHTPWPLALCKHSVLTFDP